MKTKWITKFKTLVAVLATVAAVGCGSNNDNAGVGGPLPPPNGFVNNGMWPNGNNGFGTCSINNGGFGVMYNGQCLPQQQALVCQLPNGMAGIAVPSGQVNQIGPIYTCNVAPQPITPMCYGGIAPELVPYNGINVWLCRTPNMVNLSNCSGVFAYNNYCYNNMNWQLYFHL